MTRSTQGRRNVLGISLEETLDILTKARDHLIKVGLFKGGDYFEQWEVEDGCTVRPTGDPACCAIGALAWVDQAESLSFIHSTYYKPYEYLDAALVDMKGQDWHDKIPIWNDTRATKTGVIKLYNLAIAMVEKDINDNKENA